MNSQAGRGKNDVSAYEAVFGLAFDHQFLCSKEDARKCWTVNECMLLVTNDKEFNENVEMDYILSDPEDYLADEEDGLDYFSGDEVSADETEEVTDENFFAHLLDGPISIHQSGNKKTSSSLPDPTTTDAAAVRFKYDRLSEQPKCT